MDAPSSSVAASGKCSTVPHPPPLSRSDQFAELPVQHLHASLQVRLLLLERFGVGRSPAPEPLEPAPVVLSDVGAHLALATLAQQLASVIDRGLHLLHAIRHVVATNQLALTGTVRQRDHV